MPMDWALQMRTVILYVVYTILEEMGHLSMIKVAHSGIITKDAYRLSYFKNL